MRTPIFSCAFIAIIATAIAKPIETEISLKNIGSFTADRLSGMEIERQYLIPVPVRRLEGGEAEVRLEMTPSPFLGEDCLITVAINDEEVLTRAIPKEEHFVLRVPVPKGPRLDPVARDFLKLSVKGALNPPKDETRCEALSSGTLWVDVEPASAVIFKFDNTNPDWTSIARLPYTVRPNVVVQPPPANAPWQRELGLRLSSWAAYIARESDLRFGFPTDAVDAANDYFVVEDARGREPGIEVTPVGASRVIKLIGTSENDCEILWNALRVIDRRRLPGANWEVFFSKKDPYRAKQKAVVRIEALEPNFVGYNRGIGDMSRWFRFDDAMLGETLQDLTLHLEGTYRQLNRAGSAAVAVFLNDDLVFTRDLDVDSTQFDWNVTLAAKLLKGDNFVKVTVNYVPDEHECSSPFFNYYWQFGHDCSLIFKGGGGADEPKDLIEAAQLYFARHSYDVVMAADSDWKVAACGVVWLQKVNKAMLIEPTIAERISRSRPAVLLASESEPLLSENESAGLPVSLSGRFVEFRAEDGSDLFRVSPETSVGIWQFAKIDGTTPAVVLSPWGPAGERSLLAVSQEMVESPWVGDGDVVVGDGVMPVMTTASYELVPKDISRVQASAWAAEWKKWRWWLVAALWILLSSVIAWILRNARAHARK